MAGQGVVGLPVSTSAPRLRSTLMNGWLEPRSAPTGTAGPTHGIQSSPSEMRVYSASEIGESSGTRSATLRPRVSVVRDRHPGSAEKDGPAALDRLSRLRDSTTARPFDRFRSRPWGREKTDRGDRSLPFAHSGRIVEGDDRDPTKPPALSEDSGSGWRGTCGKSRVVLQRRGGQRSFRRPIRGAGGHHHPCTPRWDEKADLRYGVSAEDPQDSFTGS
jgi:hypothetical protein